jgi:hypothetical protein
MIALKDVLYDEDEVLLAQVLLCRIHRPRKKHPKIDSVHMRPYHCTVK